MFVREGENYSIYLISKGLRPFVSPTGEGNEGEKIFFLVIGTFKGCPLSHDFVVTASRPATGRKKRGFASTKLDSCPPPAPSHAYTFLRRGLRWRGRGRIFYISHFKGGFHPPLEPPKGQ